MRLIAGLMDPTKGKLCVLGLDSVKEAQTIQRRISYMPQKFGLYEDLTIQENMELYADLHGVPKEKRPERFHKLLTMMGLERFTDRLAGNLSGGMKQKLGLSCTLVRSPELLLLDEPTVGVDPLSRRELWEILQEFVHEENLSVLVSTAYMNEAALCQKVYVLNKGQLLFSGTPDGLAEVARGRCYALESPKSSRPVSCRPSSSMTGTMWSMPCPAAGRFILSSRKA
ncbi:ABC transporter ATP-binding protein [Acidaminococcus intestini]|nr:ABC transporter ATP-binding protein [Acidaminococcus intestini]